MNNTRVQKTRQKINNNWIDGDELVFNNDLTYLEVSYNDNQQFNRPSKVNLYDSVLWSKYPLIDFDFTDITQDYDLSFQFNLKNDRVRKNKYQAIVETKKFDNFLSNFKNMDSYVVLWSNPSELLRVVDSENMLKLINEEEKRCIAFVGQMDDYENWIASTGSLLGISVFPHFFIPHRNIFSDKPDCEIGFPFYFHISEDGRISCDSLPIK